MEYQKNAACQRFFVPAFQNFRYIENETRKIMSNNALKNKESACTPAISSVLTILILLRM